MMALRYSSAERPLVWAWLARFFMADVSRMPSTSLILANRSLPSTYRPVLAPFVGFFCFVMGASLARIAVYDTLPFRAWNDLYPGVPIPIAFSAASIRCGG